MLSAAFGAAKGAVTGVMDEVNKARHEVMDEVSRDPLEAFAESDQLAIEQSFEKLEAALGIAANAVGMNALKSLGETANKYSVMDHSGKKLKVVETSEQCGGFDDTWKCCCTGRRCCAPFHKLQLHVYRKGFFSKKEVLLIDRPFKGPKCCCACCECCLQEMTLYAADETTGDIAMDDSHKIGTVKQPCLGGVFAPRLNVMDRDGESVATVTGPTCCVGGFCCDSRFAVTAPDGKEMGEIINKRPTDDEGWARELLSDADRYSITFPKAADPKTKALMMTSLFLLDYMIFEDGGNFIVDVLNCRCSIKCCDLFCCGCLCPCHCVCDCSGNNGGDSE